MIKVPKGLKYLFAEKNKKCGVASAVAGTKNPLWTGWFRRHCKSWDRTCSCTQGQSQDRSLHRSFVFLQCCIFSQSSHLFSKPLKILIACLIQKVLCCADICIPRKRVALCWTDASSWFKCVFSALLGIFWPCSYIPEPCLMTWQGLVQGEGQGRARGQAERGMHSTWQQQTDWPREILAWFQESEVWTYIFFPGNSGGGRTR